MGVRCIHVTPFQVKEQNRLILSNIYNSICYTTLSPVFVLIHFIGTATLQCRHIILIIIIISHLQMDL